MYNLTIEETKVVCGGDKLICDCQPVVEKTTPKKFSIIKSQTITCSWDGKSVTKTCPVDGYCYCPDECEVICTS